jgi:hypothetical protein
VSNEPELYSHPASLLPFEPLVKRGRSNLHLPTRKQLRPFQEALLSWNVAFVVVCTNFLRHAKPLSHGSVTDEGYNFLYAFFRGAVRINDLLHIRSSYSFFGPLPNPGSQVGSELMFVLSVLCLATPLFATLRLFSRARLSQLILGPFAGILALFAAPFFYLYGNSYRFHLALIPFYDLYSPWLLFLTYPLSLFLSLLFWKASPDSQPTRIDTWLSRSLFASSGASLLLLAALWLPGQGYGLVRANHPEQLTIRMSRERCYGSCPVYSVIVHGDGRVEYVGEESVQDRGPHEEALSKEQLQAILQKFDNVNFFALEDRAFAWGSDTPRVRISISVAGRTKEVSSDAYFTGAKSGAQDLFVQAAAELDNVVGTSRWVKCDGPCRP